MLTMLLHGRVGEAFRGRDPLFRRHQARNGGPRQGISGHGQTGPRNPAHTRTYDPARVEGGPRLSAYYGLRRLLPDYRATVASENFGVDATYELLLPDQNILALETALTELTDGAVLITRLDDGTMPPETP